MSDEKVAGYGEQYGQDSLIIEGEDKKTKRLRDPIAIYQDKIRGIYRQSGVFTEDGREMMFGILDKIPSKVLKMNPVAYVAGYIATTGGVVKMTPESLKKVMGMIVFNSKSEYLVNPLSIETLVVYSTFWTLPKN